MKTLCDYIAPSIHDPHARIVCGRTAVVDGRCARHHPQTLEADKKARKASLKVDKARIAYNAACEDLGRRFLEGEYYVPALKIVHDKAKKTRAKLRRALKEAQ